MTITAALEDGGAAAHSAVTLALAKKDSAAHMHGMKELAETMRRKPLRIKAYDVDDPACCGSNSTKIVHFVRHGQGFHNVSQIIFVEYGRL